VGGFLIQHAMDENPTITESVAPAVQLFFSILQIAYPLVVLFVYLVSFTTRSIATARNDNDESTQQTTQLGPGGKPLPKHTKTAKNHRDDEVADFTKPQKLLFQWLTVGVTFSLLGNIVVVLAHALVERKEGWWCGQSPTVRA
jgi:hypothetical protein